MNVRLFNRYVGFVAALLFLMILGLPYTTAQTPAPNSGDDLDWKPDGTELAIAASNGVFIYDRAFQLVRHREQESPAPTVSWSPDGTKLLVGRQIWDADTLETLLEMTENYPRDWIMGGTQLYALAAYEIRLLDASDGRLLKTIPLNFQIEHARPSPDGLRLASAVAEGLFIIEIETGAITLHLQPVRTISSYTWSPDSTRIAYTASKRVEALTPGNSSGNAPEYTLGIVDIDKGLVFHTPDPLPSNVGPLNWSKDQTRIAGLASARGLFSILYIWETNTATLLNTFSLNEELATTGALEYSPFGGVLAIGINTNENARSEFISPQPAFEPVKLMLMVANNTAQIVIPETSRERLQAIAEACNAPAALVASIQADQLTDFVTQVEALPENTIPPACAADLIAVAEALQAG